MRVEFLAAVLLSLSAPLAAQSPESGLQAAVRLVGEQRFQEALLAGQAESNSLARAQAELYVLHQGGALTEALEAGLRGLRVAPRDAWLLDRTAYIALSLGAGELAERLYIELQSIRTPEEWDASAPLLQEARTLIEVREAQGRSVSRARLVVGLAVIASLAVMLLHSRKRPAGPSI